MFKIVDPHGIACIKELNATTNVNLQLRCTFWEYLNQKLSVELNNIVSKRQM